MAPPGGRRRLTRRAVLRLGSTVGTGTLAGCQIPLGDLAGDGTPTGRERPSPEAPSTASGTGPVDAVTFDGGGAAAFAEALRTVEANPGSTLRIEPGTYRLNGLGVGRDYDAAHFVTHGLEDVTIEATDAEFVFEDARLGGIHLFDGENTTLRGLTVDYETLPYTRATITAVDEATRSIAVAVDDGYPGFDEGVFTAVDPNWATVHDPETGDFLDSRCCGGSVLRFDTPEPAGAGRYRLRNVRPWRGLATGRTLVAVARVPEGSALQLVGCVDPLVENVTVHTSPLFVALVALCESPTFRGVTARPRPGSGRPVATTADGFHVVNCDPGPTFEGCHLERLQDDAFAIDAKMHRVAELLDDRTVRLGAVAATAILPGDAIEAISPDYGRLGELPAVESVEALDRRGWPDGLGSPVEVTFASGVADRLEAGSFLLNRSRSNAGFAIRDCVARDLRARHVRITSRDGVVEGNEFDGSTSPAVLLQPTTGYTFHPKGPAENVTIRDNTISRAGLNGFTTPWPAAVVAWVNLEDGVDGRHPPGHPNRNVVVESNTIRNVAHRGVHVADTAGVVVRDNVVERPNRRERPVNAYGFGFDNARGVEVGGNRVAGSGESLEEFAVRSRTSDLTATGNEFVVDGSAAAARVVERDAFSW